MISVSKSRGAGGVRPSKPAGGAKASEAFRLDGAARSAPAQGAAAAVETAPPSALAALIALQSDGGGKARNRALAERTLELLENLRDGLLSGEILTADLRMLADAASAKMDEPDEKLAALYADIALRARVELAKLGG